LDSGLDKKQTDRGKRRNVRQANRIEVKLIAIDKRNREEPISSIDWKRANRRTVFLERNKKVDQAVRWSRENVFEQFKAVGERERERERVMCRLRS
jgi:hypothetical protein